MRGLRELLRADQPLPYAEVPALRRAVVRTTVLRAGLGAGAAAVFAAALAVALGRDARPDPVLPPGTTGMIVLDLSASTGLHPKIGELLRRVAATDQRTGVVVFSDVAYELVPPGTPARNLEPMVRFFAGDSPTSPWEPAFSAGTNISVGLEAARAALDRDGVERGAILLVSDLEAFSGDAVRLPALLASLRTEGTTLRVLPLGARVEQRRFFERIAGPDVFVEPDALPTGGSVDAPASLDEERTPWAFVALGALLAVLLACNERLCGRLRLPRPAEGGA